MAKNDPTGRTALYRLLAANGRLLYVGIAGNPDSRWGQHSTQQKWWADVVDRKVEWFPDRAAAAAAEVAAIKTERPLHNIQHAVVDKPAIPARAANSGDVPPPDEEWPPPPSGVPGDRLPFKRSGSAMSVGSGATQADHSAAATLPYGRAAHERMPPQDLAAEQSVLGGMLLSKDAIADVVRVLHPADYYRPAHALIHTAVTDLNSRGEPADPITVSSELVKRGEITRVGGPSYLHTLVNSVPTAANAEYYAEIVHERAVLRRLVEAGTRIAQMGYAAEGDVDEIVCAARAEIWAVSQ